MFPTAESARLLLESRLWANGVTCPSCKGRSASPCARAASTAATLASSISPSAPEPSSSGRTFLCTMALRHVPARHRAQGHLYRLQLAKEIGVTQKSAWFMLHRLREAMRQPRSIDKLQRHRGIGRMLHRRQRAQQARAQEAPCWSRCGRQDCRSRDAGTRRAHDCRSRCTSAACKMQRSASMITWKSARNSTRTSTSCSAIWTGCSSVTIRSITALANTRLELPTRTASRASGRSSNAAYYGVYHKHQREASCGEAEPRKKRRRTI